MAGNNPSSNGTQPYQPHFHISEEVTSLHETIRVTEQGCEIKTVISKKVSDYNTPINGDENSIMGYGQISATSYVLENDGRFNVLQPGLPSCGVENYAKNNDRQQADTSDIVQSPQAMSESDYNRGNAVDQFFAENGGNQDYAVDLSYAESNYNWDAAVHQSNQSYDNRDYAVHQSNVQSYNNRNYAVDQSRVQTYDNQNYAVSQSRVRSYDNRNYAVDQSHVQSYDNQNYAVDQSHVQRYDNRDYAVHQSHVQKNFDNWDDTSSFMGLSLSDAETVVNQDEVTSAVNLHDGGSNASTLLVSSGIRNDVRNYNVQYSSKPVQLGAENSSVHNVGEQQQEIQFQEQLIPTQETDRWKCMYEVHVRENADLRKALKQTKNKLDTQKAISDQLADICSRYDARNDSVNVEMESLNSEIRASREKMDTLLKHNLALISDVDQYKKMLSDLQAKRDICKEHMENNTKTFYQNLLESTKTRHQRETAHLNEQIQTLTAALEKKNTEQTCHRQTMEELRSQLQAKSGNEKLLNQQLQANEIEIKELKTGHELFAKLTAAFIQDFSNVLSILLHNESHKNSSVAQLQRTDHAAFEKLIQQVRETCSSGDLQLSNLNTFLAKVGK